MTFRRILLLFVSAAVVCLPAFRPPAAGAQSLFLTQDDLSYVGFEVLRTQFDGSSDMSILTLTGYATVHYKIDPTVALVVELPYARYDPEGYGHQSTQGDFYIGLEQRAARSGPSFEFGVRLPTTSESKGAAATVGIFSDLNRWEAFLPKVFSIVPAVNYRYVDAQGLGIRLRGAPSVDIPTEEGGDAEVYGLYAIQFIYLGSGGEATLGVSGRILLTEDDLDFGQRSLHELDASVTLAGTKVRPGLQLRIPIDDDYQDFVDAVFGLQLTILID